MTEDKPMTDNTEKLPWVKHVDCPRCLGAGTLDDAEPGDMSFNEWECPDCKGKKTFPYYSQAELDRRIAGVEERQRERDAEIVMAYSKPRGDYIPRGELLDMRDAILNATGEQDDE